MVLNFNLLKSKSVAKTLSLNSRDENMTDIFYHDDKVLQGIFLHGIF